MKKNNRKLVIAFLAMIIMLALSMSVMACGGGNQKITLNQTTANLEVGEEFTLVATLEGIKGTVTWSSSDTTKATVDNGKVVGVAAGKVTITAQIEKLSATCEVTVTDNQLPVIELDYPFTQIYTGQSLNLTADVYYRGEKKDDAVVTFTSDNESVATVSESGVVTGVAKGKAVITAGCTYDTNKTATPKTVEISVTDLKFVNITTENGQTVKTGETLQISAKAISGTSEVASPKFTYSVSDETKATISETGLLTAKSATDSLQVYVSFEGISDYITIGIDYAEAYTGTVELLPTDNSGTYKIDSDLDIESVKLNGSNVTLNEETDGFSIDVAEFDVNLPVQELIIRDVNGIDYVAKVNTAIKESSANVLSVRKESGFVGQIENSVSDKGREGLTKIIGQNNLGWQNSFRINDCGGYYKKGFRYLAIDYYFQRDPDDGYRDLLQIFNSTQNGGQDVPYTMQIGTIPALSSIKTFNIAHMEAGFTADGWNTLVFDLSDFNGFIEAFAYGEAIFYFDNVRFMSEGSFADYTENKLSVVEIPLTSVIARSETPFTMNRETGNYQGRENVVKMTGNSASTWQNCSQILVGGYSDNFKWILVDFYFETGIPAGFNVTSAGDYRNIEQGAELGAFYGVEKTSSGYTTSEVTTGKWVTMAFRLSEMGAAVDWYAPGASIIYVDNVRVVTSSEIDELA